MKTLILLIFFLVVSIFCNAQQIVDSISSKGVVTLTPEAKAIEIFNFKSRRIFLLHKDKSVWIYCQNKKGKIKIRRAKVVDITNDEITFKPISENFAAVTYPVSDITHIGFTSAGRIIIASVADIVIVGTVVMVFTILTISAILSGTSPNFYLDPSLRSVPLVPFKKNVDFYESRRGNSNWGVRIITHNQKSSVE